MFAGADGLIQIDYKVEPQKVLHIATSKSKHEPDSEKKNVEN